VLVGGAVLGGGRDRLGPLVTAVATLLQTLLDPDALWLRHVRTWVPSPPPPVPGAADDPQGAVTSWLAGHAVVPALQLVSQGLIAGQQIALAGLQLNEGLYHARHALLRLLGALITNSTVRGHAARDCVAQCVCVCV
jgi:hypothetical protein